MTPVADMHAFEGAVIAERYRLVECLDEGAFGAVYRASHLAYEVELREVAIKLSKRPMSSQEARQVFADALLMARVADATADAAMREHFVTVHDAGRCPEGSALGGHPYVVMELVRGGSLKGCLRVGSFPLTRAIAYFEQILKAVAFMHGGILGAEGRHRPIAHRDLKPSNVLVTRPREGADVLKVTDFGLAVEVDTLLGWVESGGDLAYLAPECFSHNVSSPQSDVYMLGLLFYEMLTGTNPFAEVGNHLRGSDQKHHAELRRLHLQARQLERFSLLENHEEIRQHQTIGRVVRTALAPDMRSRSFTNASEFYAAWREALKPSTGGGQAIRPWQRVEQLTAQAEQCIAAGDRRRAEELLLAAMQINRDPRQVPDRMTVGRCYLLLLDLLLAQGKTAEASELAFEGYRRRVCRSTCLAMARSYRSQGSSAAAGLEAEARSCKDQA